MPSTQPTTEYTVYRLTSSGDKTDPLSGDDKIAFNDSTEIINIKEVDVSPDSPPATTDNPTSQEPNSKEDVGVSKIVITITGHIDMRKTGSKAVATKCRQWLTQAKENSDYKVGRFGFYSKNDFAEWNLIPGVEKGYTLVSFRKTVSYDALGKKDFIMVLELGAGVSSLGEGLPP